MSATRTTCVRKRELYTQPCTRAHAHERTRTRDSSRSSLPARAVHHSSPVPRTHTLAAVTPTPSSLLTLPVDSCCPALSATLTRAVSVAENTHATTHSQFRHSAFPLHRRFADCEGASERGGRVSGTTRGSGESERLRNASARRRATTTSGSQRRVYGGIYPWHKRARGNACGERERERRARREKQGCR